MNTNFELVEGENPQYTLLNTADLITELREKYTDHNEIHPYYTSMIGRFIESYAISFLTHPQTRESEQKPAIYIVGIGILSIYKTIEWVTGIQIENEIKRLEQSRNDFSLIN